MRCCVVPNPFRGVTVAGCVSATGEMVAAAVLCGLAGANCHVSGGWGWARARCRACPLSPSRGPHGRVCVFGRISFALIAGGRILL